MNVLPTTALSLLLSVLLLLSAAPAAAETLDEITASPEFRQPHAEVLRLYFAFFDRAPDPGGARYWIDRYNDGIEIEAIAESMGSSDEYVARYGGTDDAVFIGALYNNVLDRSSDPGGFAYWMEMLQGRQLTRGEIVRLFSASTEFVADHRFVGEENALPGPPPGRTTTLGRGARLIRFSIEVEAGIDAGEDSVRAEVIRILGDRRSWIAEGTMRFQTSSVADADVRIRVASPATVDRRCHPLGTGGRLSCRNGRSLNINIDRWNGATSFWSDTLATYRSYLINHEMGHFLGHRHRRCPGGGRPAPVMQQQTKALNGCRENGWPHPNG